MKDIDPGFHFVDSGAVRLEFQWLLYLASQGPIGEQELIESMQRLLRQEKYERK